MCQWLLLNKEWPLLVGDKPAGDKGLSFLLSEGHEAWNQLGIGYAVTDPLSWGHICPLLPVLTLEVAPVSRWCWSFCFLWLDRVSSHSMKIKAHLTKLLKRSHFSKWGAHLLRCTTVVVMLNKEGKKCNKLYIKSVALQSNLTSVNKNSFHFKPFVWILSKACTEQMHIRE